MVHTGTVYQTTKRLKLFDAPFKGNVLRYLNRGCFVIGTDRRRLQRRVRVLYPQPGYVNISLGYLESSARTITSLLRQSRSGKVVFRGEVSDTSSATDQPAHAATNVSPSPTPSEVPSAPEPIAPSKPVAAKQGPSLAAVEAEYQRAEAVSYENTRGVLEMLLFNATRELVADVAWEAYGESCLSNATRELVVETVEESYEEQRLELEREEARLLEQIKSERAAGALREQVEREAALRFERAQREKDLAAKSQRSRRKVAAERERKRKKRPQLPLKPRLRKGRRSASSPPKRVRPVAVPRPATIAPGPDDGTPRSVLMAMLHPSQRRRRPAAQFPDDSRVLVSLGGWKGHRGTVSYTCPDGKITIELDDCYGQCRLPATALRPEEIRSKQHGDYERWLRL